MSIKERLKKLEKKTKPENEEYAIIVSGMITEDGIKVEKDGKIYGILAIVEKSTNKFVEINSQEGRKMLLEEGYRIIPKDFA